MGAMGEIIHLSYPSTVSVGRPVNVFVAVRNIGDYSGNVFARLCDNSTGTNISSIEWQMSPSQIVGGNFLPLTMPNRLLELRVDVGHTESEVINPFGVFSIGPSGAYSYHNDALMEYIYGTYPNGQWDSEYITRIGNMLSDLNMNTAGGITNHSLMGFVSQHPNPPYFFGALRLNGDDYYLPGTRFPDMSPEYRAYAEEWVAKVTGILKNNPYLLGYFTTNELQIHKVSDSQFLEFVNFIVPLIRSYDPTTPIISDRIGGVTDFDPTDPSFAGKAQALSQFDVVALNLYPYTEYQGYAPWQLERLDALHRVTGRPILISEAGIAHRTAQVPTTPSRWQGRLVDTDAQRGVIYTNMLNQLLQKPYVVGMHYYVWDDVSNAESVGCGIVKNDLSYYTEMANAIRLANLNIPNR